MVSPAELRFEDLPKEFQENYHCREWRLDNLYYIVDKDGKKVKFRLRPAQRELLRSYHWRNVILKARQLGFSTFIALFALDCVVNRDNFAAAIISHTKEHAAEIYYNKILFAYDNLPEMYHYGNPTKKRDAGELRLSNNSYIKVSCSIMGGTYQLLHVSELATIAIKSPEKARAVKQDSLPAIHQHGMIFIESSPKGREGFFYEMCEDAQKNTAKNKKLSNLQFKMHFYPWWKEPDYTMDPKGIIIPSRLKKYFKEKEGILKIKFTSGQKAWYTLQEATQGTDMFNQYATTIEESFKVAIEGAYFKTEINEAYAEGRICDVPYDPNYAVETIWDIGENRTSIWFTQTIGKWCNFIDYCEDSGEGLGHYKKQLVKRKYKYGKHIGPHDLKVRSWVTDNKSRWEIAKAQHKIVFELCPELSLADGIEASRSFMKRCRFDESKCEKGLDGLASYKKRWNNLTGDWRDEPLGDWASHPADAYRYRAITHSFKASNAKSDNALAKAGYKGSA